MPKKKPTDPLRVVYDALCKEFGADTATLLGYGDSRARVEEVIPTGIEVLDRHVLGIGGLPIGRSSEVYSEEGVGKAQPLDAQVLTDQGFVPIGSLSVGDDITDPTSGKCQRVVGVYPQGEREVYRVTTTDGGSTECCLEHLWRTMTPKGGVVRSLGEIKDTLRENHGKWKTWRHHLPTVAPVHFRGRGTELPLNPYLLGLLLGDGSFRGSSIMFHNSEPDLQEGLAESLPAGDSAVLCNDGAGQRIGKQSRLKNKEPSATMVAIRHMGLDRLHAHEKFVPSLYLTAGLWGRFALLCGLFDTDGYVIGRGTSLVYATSSPHLARAAIHLVRSLGGLAAVSSRIPNYTYKGEKREGRLAYRVRVSFVDGTVPVSSKKHLARWRKRRQPHYRSITGVEFSRVAECVCIKVSSPLQLYVTDDFIVTHNTSLMLQCLAGVQRIGGLAILIETENALQPEWAEDVHGVDIDRLLLVEADCLEDTTERIHQAVVSLPLGAGPALIAWDSIASTPTRSEVETGESNPGVRARELSQFCRRIAKELKKYRAHIMFVNQVRERIGVMFGNKFVTPGGHAVKFMASIRLQMFPGKAVKTDHGDHTGKAVTVLAVKNRLHPPWRKAKIRLDYKSGWDDKWSTMAHAKERELIPPRVRSEAAYQEAREKLGWKEKA